MACALLTLMALDHENDGLKTKASVAMVLSNQDSASFAAGSVQTKENHLAAVTFDWTNGSVFRSSVRFTPSTNLTN